ncbi:hypothetical protein MHTCC0001_07000 [Flavobacteriaceae bacterium MHTCC 0001]
MYVLFWLLTAIAIGFLSNLLDQFLDVVWGPAVLSIFILGTLIPWLAVNVRRLHDSGKSGGYLFINLIPLIGRIWYLVLMCSEGDNGFNRYGPDPKKPIIDDEIDDIGKPQIEA